jgi:hypothetical protein
MTWTVAACAVAAQRLHRTATQAQHAIREKGIDPMLGWPPRMSRLRPFTLLVALLALVVGAAGCGGSGSEADSSTDVNQLLEETFSGKKKVDSGKLDLKLRFEPESGDTGPVSVAVSGPFQTQGKGKLPKFDIDASLEGAGQSFKAGITSTGDKAFVNFQGTDYAVSDPIYKQFVAGYEEAQKKASKGAGGDQPSLATLGIDPRRWLKDATNAGEAKVGDADVIKITGGVDVPRLLDDVNTALEKTRSLGVQGAQGIPEKLTAEQRRQVEQAVKDLKVEIYTGKEDKTLRRMLIDLRLETPASGGTAAQSGAITLDFSILGLNDDQEISAPSSAKPFEELLSQLGGLGGLGGLGSGSGSGSGSSGSGSSGSSGSGANAEDLKKYSKCIEDAGNDTAKVSKCADLLAP